MRCVNCDNETDRYACQMCEPLTPREKALWKTVQVFGKSHSYSALWEAIVTAYELVYTLEEKAKGE